METSLRGRGPSFDADDTNRLRTRYRKAAREPIILLSLREGIMIAYWREF